MTEQSEPPRKLSRQERRHAEREGAKRRVSTEFTVEDAEAYAVGGAYLATAGENYAQLGEIAGRIAELMGHIERDASGGLDEGWKTAFFTETQQWKDLAAQTQDLAPSAPVMDVHRRLQRYCAEVIAAAEGYEAAFDRGDSATIDAANEHVDKAHALDDDINQSLARVQEEMARVQVQLGRSKRAQ